MKNRNVDWVVIWLVIAAELAIILSYMLSGWIEIEMQGFVINRAFITQLTTLYGVVNMFAGMFIANVAWAWGKT